MTWGAYIERLNSGLDLEPFEVQSVMATILDGKALAATIKENLALRVAILQALLDHQPGRGGGITDTDRQRQ